MITPNGPSTWSDVPSEIAPVLRRMVPQTTERIIRALSTEAPQHGWPLTGEFARTMRKGVEAALYQFVELVEADQTDPLGPTASIYYELGRHEFREGRRLDALLGAYRIGARLAWQDVVPACEDYGVESRVIYRLAEAMFVYIHELSAVSAEGYSAEQAAEAGTAQAARQELVELLTIRQPASSHALEMAAIRAGWRLPRTVAALVTDVGEPAKLAVRVGSGAIGARIGGLVCILIPDPPEHTTDRLVESLTLTGIDAALGPTVAREETAGGWDWARRTLELVEQGAIKQRGVVRVDDHLATILLHADERLAATFARRRLDALESLTERARQQLPETLLAWLSHHGDVRRAANDLHVHPQTVRYRLEKLAEAYGDALDDPDSRFELQLALRITGLRVRPLLSAGAPRSQTDPD